VNSLCINVSFFGAEPTIYKTAMPCLSHICNYSNCDNASRAETKMPPKPRRQQFRGTDFEKELEAMLSAGQLNLTMGAREVYPLTEYCKCNVDEAKFENWYYNWKKQKIQNVEKARTGGIGPPRGKCKNYRANEKNLLLLILCRRSPCRRQ
jgi:hypothetical protein